MGLLDDAIREHLDLKRRQGADPGEVERLEREALGPVHREPRGHSMGSVPQLEVSAGPEHDYEPATELHQHAAPVQEPRRGFLRRNRPAPTPRPAAADFEGYLDAPASGDADESHGDPVDHPDPFGQDAFDHDDPFRDGDSLAHDGSPTQEHAGSPAEPSSAVPPAEPVAGGGPAHLSFDSAPPPRPSFAPTPPSILAEPESASADAAELEPPVDPSRTVAAEPVTPNEPAPAEPAPDAHDRADATGETREWSVEEAFAAQDSGSETPAAPAEEEDVLEETPEFLQDTPDHDRLWFEQRPPRDFDFDS